MNKTIKLLMLSDVIILTGEGLILPILAIFIKEDIVGGTIFAAGFASTLYLLTKSIIQLPFSKYVDSHKNKIKWLLMGSFLIASVPFIYIFADHINHIYLAQIVYGIGSGLAYPTWLGIFSTHLDKKHESFEWSLYSTLVGLGTAATAAIGAAIAQFVGFNWTFLFVGILSIIGSSLLFGLEKNHYKQKLNVQHNYKRKKLVNHNRK